MSESKKTHHLLQSVAKLYRDFTVILTVVRGPAGGPVLLAQDR
jgi:hypothetical protein